MYKFFFLGMMGLILGACSSLENSEVTMKVNSEKRKLKHQLMLPEEKPIETNPKTEKIPSIAPQVGIRIPLEK